MRIGLIAKKIGMSRFFDSHGVNQCATILQVDKCKILDIRNNRKVSLNFKSCFFPSGLCLQHAVEEGYFLRGLHPRRFFSEYDKKDLSESVLYCKEEHKFS